MLEKDINNVRGGEIETNLSGLTLESSDATNSTVCATGLTTNKPQTPELSYHLSSAGRRQAQSAEGAPDYQKRCTLFGSCEPLLYYKY
jgi:hypothetical protein